MKLLVYTPEPAELRGIRHAARERLEGAQREMGVACDVWAAYPYDPERALAAQLASEEIDNAIAAGGEWDIPNWPKQTIRAGNYRENHSRT